MLWINRPSFIISNSNFNNQSLSPGPPEMREQVHKQRIKVGTKGYFMEGRKKVV